MAEASKVDNYLCPSEVHLPGSAEVLSPPLCQVFTGLSVQAVPATTGPAPLLPSAHKAE